ALLRINRRGLARTDAEERRIEHARVIDESATARVGGAWLVAVWMVETLQRPAPITGQWSDRVESPIDQFPELLGCAHSTRKATGHRHDRDGLASSGFELLQLLLGL